MRKGVEDQLVASFAPSTKSFETIIQRFVAEPGSLLKGPWLSLDMPFRRAEGVGEFFPDIPLGFRPYRHQERAFSRLSGQKPLSTVVATGTGSGKTECFLLPILQHCLNTKGSPGIKAIVIYPMNALAADQARRLARLIGENERLAGIRVGMYADEAPKHPSTVMTETDVINSRDELVRNPPDILLTNYKMLDYMLIRPNERDIWLKNRPETLRYLVVDELHTFDGAQGTDLASLIRRVKARLRMAKGSLCCIGTSATLGGPNAVEDLVTYVGKIFDEAFDATSIITEDRKTVASYLEDIPVTTISMPDAAAVEAAVESVDKLEPNEFVKQIYRLWFDMEPLADFGSAAARVALGQSLDGHLFFQTLLKILKGRPTEYASVRTELRRNRLYATLSDQQIDALLDTITALVAHARRIDAESGTSTLAPFFSVRHQVWIRELARMVASVEAQPRLRHYDDLLATEQKSALPVVHCRSCGGAGWATVAPNDMRRPIEAEPREVYEAYFGYSDRLRFVFREQPAVITKRSVPGQTMRGWLCPACLTVHYHDARPDAACSSCGRDAGDLLEVFVHKPGRMTSDAFRVDHDCPFCGGPSGMGILGARSVTLVSGVVGRLFASEFNDDPKLLTFSDSVQDAAHRAAVFQARNATTVFRSGLARFIADQEESDLAAVREHAPKAMHSQFEDPDFVATYLPADLEWRSDYGALLDNDALPGGSRLPEFLEERLRWEALAELTFRSRLGATVERIGAVALHVPMNLIEAATDDFRARMKDEIAVDPDQIPRSGLLKFVIGLLDHMRARGAVVDPVTQRYVEREANWYAVVKSYNGGRNSLPNYAPAAPKPCFPANRAFARFEPVAFETSAGWYVPWFHKCFDASFPLTGDLAREFFALIFDVLGRQGIAVRLDVANKAEGAGSAWGLRPESVKVFASSSRIRCSSCGNWHAVPHGYEPGWAGMNCTRIGCRGTLSNIDAPPIGPSRQLTAGRIKRVIAAEHTSLLDREKRQRIEERFMSDAPRSWYPNLLAATPTLELGINIGDLSTLILCSVPPEQANYVQRIGRTGRRDGNSLNITVATARPHDMWYWTEPQEMIAGTVKTPGVHLQAVSILRRQFAAYTLDCWVAEEGAEYRSYGKLGEVLRAIRTRNGRKFPLYWYDFIQKNADRLFEGFVALFPELRGDAQSLDNIRTFAHGGERDGLAHRVASEFADLANEIESIQTRIEDTTAVEKRLKAETPPPTDLAERLDDLKGEKRSLARIRDEIRRRDTLGFLTDRGILPNYAFPEQGVTLRSILYRSDPERSEDRPPTITDYVRSASSALVEFAPSASFYVEGRKLKIDQIDLSASPIEHWRMCPECTHIAPSESGPSEKPCPSCGSVMWSDKGSRRPMIRLKQVLALSQERNARIGDDGDDRDRRFFDRDYLPAFDRDQIGDAYAIDDGVLPFAFEHIRRCTFRELNFGETGDAATGQKVAGERRHGHGFRICRSCGKVQHRDRLRRSSQDQPKLGLHSPRCPEAQSEDDATYVSVVYLYREFNSEAIRFLLPLASSTDDGSVNSMRAAIDLGLRLHFKGKVDHLRSSLVETKEGPLTRRYLYLYDTVPGGTGYLKQLALRTDEMKDVFERALMHMRECACTQDPHKDGCPRCIRSHASTFGRGEISRDRACQLLGEILSSWGKLRKVSTISEVSLNKALESELEAMFVERLRAAVRARGGKLNKIVVNGQPGYFLRIGTGEWQIEPQVEMHLRFAKMPATRADFVIWPAVPTPDAKPIAIYLDGWQWHEHRVPDDLALRQTLLRSGRVLVWSLTWDDMERLPNDGKPKHYWDPLMPLARERIEKLDGGDVVANDLEQLIGDSAFGHLLTHLSDSDPQLWTDRARNLSTALFLKGFAGGKEKDAVLARTAAMAGTEGADTIEAVWGTATVGLVDASGIGVAAVAVDRCWHPPMWPQLPALTAVVGFEHQIGVSSDAKRAWNGALRLMNLLQFLPWMFIGCRDGIPLSPALRPIGPDTDDGWAEVESLVLSEILALVSKLRAGSLPVPEALFEVARPDGTVAGTLELAWPDRKIGVVLDPKLVPLFGGWNVVVYKGDPGETANIIGGAL